MLFKIVIHFILYICITVKFISNDNNYSSSRTVKTIIMKALKIKFEVSKEKPFNPDFVAKIKRSDEDFKNGKFTSLKVEDLGKYIDNL